jgi:glycosyltransferase involved in cell wall biosynthesis
MTSCETSACTVPAAEPAPDTASDRLPRAGTAASGRPPMVLHVRVVTGHGGGPEKTILNSPRFLRNLGYQSKLAYLHPPGDPGFDAIVRRGQALDAEVLSVPDRGAWDFSVLTRLARICREQRVDIWHGHDYKSNALGLLLRAWWPMRLVTTLHGWTNLSGRVPYYVQIDKWCLKYYQAAICVSDDLVAECAKCRVPPRRCHLIHNAIDTDDYRRTIVRADAKQRLGAGQDDFLIGAVGRLSPEKGFDLLIRAAVELRQQGHRVSLWIAGEGAARPQLEQLIAELRCQPFVRLLGHVADPKLLYQALDTYVLSSFREGLPNVVLEAMALEAPVVATRIAGVPKMITDGQDGLLVNPHDQNAITAAIARLLADPLLRSRLATAGRSTIESRFSFQRRMERVVAVYDDVLRRSDPRGAGEKGIV